MSGSGPVQDPEGNESLALERIAFFSDAVIAIALTLMAIDLKLPEGGATTDAAFLQLLGSLGPRYFAFVISFFVVALYWRAHHRMFRYIERWDGGLLGVNMLFLFVVVQQPLFASMLGSFGDVRAAVAIYAIGLSLLGFTSLGMWLYAVRRKLVTPGLPVPYVRYTAVRSGGVAVMFLASAGLALISPFLAQVSWVFITFSSFLLRRWMLSD